MTRRGEICMMSKSCQNLLAQLLQRDRISNKDASNASRSNSDPKQKASHAQTSSASLSIANRICSMFLTHNLLSGSTM